MATSVQSRWAVRLAALVLWGLAAGSCVYWGLKIAPSAPSAAVAAPVRVTPPADPIAVARILGASPAISTGAAATPVASLASRFNLLGVVASRSHRGAALIAVDGKPPRPFHVGSLIDTNLVLQAVEGRRATLAASIDGPAVLTLELPQLKR
jgi:general secretion pathway protein C